MHVRHGSQHRKKNGNDFDLPSKFCGKCTGLFEIKLGETNGDDGDDLEMLYSNSNIELFVKENY